MNAEALLGRLEHVSGRGERLRADCPCCGAHNGALSVLDKGDTLLIHCFACQANGMAVCEALRVEVDALFADARSHADPSYRRKPIHKPYRASEVLSALQSQLEVLWIVLCDVIAGKPVDVDKLKEARRVVSVLIEELERAYG